MGNSQPTSRNAALKRSAVKLQAQKVSEFNGNELKWKSWKKKTRAAIGSAGLLDIFDNAEIAENNVVDNETVFHILQVATADGNASHLVDSHEEDKNGHFAYKDLVAWYKGDSMTTETAESIRSKLDKLYLNTRITASEYINYFKLYTKQLNELEESYTLSKTVTIFLSQITDPDYSNTKELCIENKYDIDECINRIRSKERRLGRDNPRDKSKSISIRRNIKLEGSNQDEIDIEQHLNERGYYSVPNDIWNQLTQVDQESVKKFNGNLRNSRRNKGRRTPDDKPSITNRRVSSNEHDNNKDDANPSPTKKLRTVQFREQDSDSNVDDNENVGDKKSSESTMNARRGVLSLQVKDK